MFNISAVVICKNEESNIKNCINSLIDFFGDIVVIDTGSTDSTIYLLSCYQRDGLIRLYNYEWKRSFSDARNYGISLANFDWVFFIDADEVLASESKADYLNSDIVSFLNEENNISFSVKIEDSFNSLWSYVPRGLKKSSGLHYYGNVHEIIISKDQNAVASPVIPITLRHYGYQPYMQWKKGKFYRNLSLLRPMLIKGIFNDRWRFFYVRNSISNGSFNSRIFMESIYIIDISFSKDSSCWSDGITITKKILELSLFKGYLNVIVFLYLRYRKKIVMNTLFIYYINEFIKVDQSSITYIEKNIPKKDMEGDFNFAKSKNAFLTTPSNAVVYVSELNFFSDVILSPQENHDFLCDENTKL